MATDKNIEDARIFVAWNNSQGEEVAWVSSLASDFQAVIVEMTARYGPPSLVEFRTDKDWAPAEPSPDWWFQDPIYQHDCKECDHYGIGVIQGHVYDLYHCNRSMPKGEMSVRYGNGGAEYYSIDVDTWEQVKDSSRAHYGPLYSLIMERHAWMQV